MRRRDFLQVGTAGLATAMAARSSDALAGQTGGAAPAAPIVEPIALGYWIGSGHRRDLGQVPLASAGAADQEEAFAPDVAPAEPAGVARSPVRLGLHGLVEAARRPFERSLSGLSLLVDFTVPEVGTVRYAAWRYDRLPVRHVSRTVRLVVPLDPSGRLHLALERRRGQIPAETWLSARRGVYFLALPGLGGVRPDWSRLQFREAGGGARRLVQRGLFGLEPARFDYLVVSIDTVSDPEAEQV
jgi:hypothetical protein